jgi:hypothetical protein
MRLLSNAFRESELLRRLEERLEARGLWSKAEEPTLPVGAEPAVDPLSFNLTALEEHADSTRPLPLQTHRGGVGRVVLLAKWAFRTSCQVFINEALARQRVFNGHVRDSYAQLSAEVMSLRAELQELRQSRAGKTRRPPRRR